MAAKLPPFGKELLSRLNVRPDCYLSICNFSYFVFRFLGRDFCSDCIKSWAFLTFHFLDRHGGGLPFTNMKILSWRVA